MSDKDVDSSEDTQTPIEFTVLQSETKSFQIPPDQDVFFTSAELLNVQPDSSNKVVTLSIEYEVVYFHSDNSSEDENKTDAATIKDGSDKLIENNNSEDMHPPTHDSCILKKALDHIIITIPISSSSQQTSDPNSSSSATSTSGTSSNQNSITLLSQNNAGDNSFSSNHNYSNNSKTNSIPIQIQFCPDMNPVFHVNGPADVKLTGFTSPTNYNSIDEEEESEAENDEMEENIQNDSQNNQNDEKISDNNDNEEKEKIDNIEDEKSTN